MVSWESVDRITPSHESKYMMGNEVDYCDVFIVPTTVTLEVSRHYESKACGLCRFQSNKNNVAEQSIQLKITCLTTRNNEKHIILFVPP